MKELKAYLDKKIVVLPLTKGKKEIKIPEWQNKFFGVQDFNLTNNIGGDLGRSNLGHVDLDSAESVYMARKTLKPTWEIMVMSPDGKEVKTTGYLYLNNNSIKEYRQLKHADGEYLAELRIEGNCVLPPSTCPSRHFEYQQCKRLSNDVEPIFDEDLEKKFNIVCVLSALARLIKKSGSNNSPIYKTYTCLLRYCPDWSEEERDQFVANINEFCGFDESYKSRIRSVKKGYEKSNKKMAGYKSLADTLKVDKFYLKDLFNLIGEVPKNEEEDRKTVVDFTALAMTEEDFKSKEKLSFLVPPVLQSEGLVILAGRPKSMKSFMGIDLAYSVVNDGLFLNTYKCDQGDVLLLSLEDGKLSHKGRIEAMGLLNKKKPTTFTQHTCPCLGKGFEESLELWVQKNKNPKLVIIDTFQKIKPIFARETQKANAYEVDYFYLSKLKDLAHKHKILIMYIHHLSQADRSHSWDKIMGSTGHQGVTDAMFMLEREDATNKGTFKGRGREIMDINIDLDWNAKGDLRYTYANDTVEKVFVDTKARVLVAMRDLTLEGETNIKPKDVARFLDETKQKEKDLIKRTMNRMADKGELNKGDSYGTYKLKYPADKITDSGQILADTPSFA